MITRVKKSLSVDSTEGLPVADLPVNEAALKDLASAFAARASAGV